MFLLAGLMGLMVVGVTVFFNIERLGVQGIPKPNEAMSKRTSHMSSCCTVPRFPAEDFQEPEVLKGVQTRPGVREVPKAFSHWMELKHQSEVRGFSSEEDNLVIVFDEQKTPAPNITLERDRADKSRKHITLDGVRIAAVENAERLQLDHITLVGQNCLRKTKKVAA